MPRPATACTRCKKRRIQCDQSRPHCDRCKGRGIQCPGYPPHLPQKLRFIVKLKDGSQGCSGIRRSKPEDPSTKLSERHVRRIALFDEFLQFYLPKDRDNSMSHFAFLGLLPHIRQSPLLETTMDVLCLAMLGSVRGDRNCLHASRVEYGKALPMLAHEVGRPHSAEVKLTPQEQILAAILILALSDVFDALAYGRQGDQGWSQHTEGAALYLRSIGPDAVAKFPALGECVYHNLRQILFCRSLVQRKSVFLAEKRWLKATKHSSKQHFYVALYDMIMQIPNVLQVYDMLSPRNYFRLCAAICQLRKGLHHWLRMKFSFLGREDYDLIDVKRMAHFASQCHDRTFDEVYSFPSVEEASQYQLYLVACFTLDTRLSGLYSKFGHHLRSLQLLDTFGRSVTELDRDIYCAATRLCKALPYCCEPWTLSAGRIGMHLLQGLQDYFQRNGHDHESKWCQAMRELLQRSGSSSYDVCSEDGTNVTGKYSGFWKFWTSYGPVVLPEWPNGLAAAL